MPSPVFPGQSYIFFCYILIDKKLNCITIMYDTIKYLTFDIFFIQLFFTIYLTIWAMQLTRL